MSALIPFLALDQPCDEVLAWAQNQLTGAGLHLVQTFDLQVARLAHHDCPCPHHGTDECNCQMIVLLVYRKQGDPLTLVMHGQDGKTWLALANSTGKRSNQQLEAAIQRVLIPYSSEGPSPIEMSHEARSTV